MDFEILQRDGAQHFKLSGELDALAVQRIRPQIEDALAASVPLHVVDTQALQLIDSSGIGLIVYMFKKASEAGAKFAVVGLNGQPADMIRFLKIDSIVPCRDTLAEVGAPG